MSKISTMIDFSKRAVENFVQTAVMVDDKIFTSSAESEEEKKKIAVAPKSRKPATKKSKRKPAKLQIVQDQEQDTDESHTFSPHDIQSSFAKKQIVCALHQPQKNHTVGINSETYKLCSCADIIIIDWDLYGDAGVKATELVENLIIQSLKDDPHQHRLVLIYTDTPNLFDIANHIYERLDENLSDEKIEYPAVDKGLAFHTSNARVVVLGKPAKRLEKFKDFEVSENDLADRAITEFYKLADGMLQGSILMGLAAIRKQSRKILTKFHSGLDAPFLTHRALSLPHEEAFDHITPLLVAEIEAILEDSLESPLVNDSILKDWCDNREFGTCAKKKVKGIDFNNFAYKFCSSGEEVLNTDGLQAQPNKKQLQNVLCPDAKTENPVVPDFSTMSELAVLMSQRTQYGNRRKTLRLGTILRECFGQERYLLCLQPVCDSVRLSGKTPFLFCYLENAGNNNITHIINADKKYCDLYFNPSKVNRAIIVFTANHKKMVAEKQEGDKKHTLSDDIKNEYLWITQLKPEHAQQAAERFAREISRVGLTESEWLHRGAKR